MTQTIPTDDQVADVRKMLAAYETIRAYYEDTGLDTIEVARDGKTVTVSFLDLRRCLRSADLGELEAASVWLGICEDRGQDEVASILDIPKTAVGGYQRSGVRKIAAEYVQ